jgi:phage terminase Nu1 subunit (DNA packaging protein)
MQNPHVLSRQIAVFILPNEVKNTGNRTGICGKQRERGSNMRQTNIVVQNGDFTLTQEAAGVLAGVTVQTMINWHKQEDAPPRNGDGTYSAKDFGKWLVEHRGSKKRGPKPKDRQEGEETFAEAERRLKLAQAIKVERENEVAAGNLIPIDVLEPQWQLILTRVRSRLLKMPTVLAPVVLGNTDAHAIQLIIRNAVVDALTELVDDWRTGSDDEGE